MSPREIHRIKRADTSPFASPASGDIVRSLSRRVIDHFARFSSAKVAIVPWEPPRPGVVTAHTTHPECTKFAGSVECGEARALQHAAIDRQAEPVWHRCPHGRLCGLVPLVCNGRCQAALQLVSRDTADPKAFARELELLELLAQFAVRSDAPASAAHTETRPTPAKAKNAAKNAPPAAAPLVRHAQVDRAIAYIDEHLSDPELSVASIAEAVGSHPDYLAHLFSAQTNERMSRYIALQRTSLARRLLASTSWQIKRVAWACGYGNPNWFSHVFHDHTGFTPADFRRNARQGP